jgi:glucuronate isomerase
MADIPMGITSDGRRRTAPRAAHSPLVLHEDRYFDPDPSVRRLARAIYDETRDLPLICPHGHVDAALLADDRAFPEPTALLITPDHYIFRLLYSQGVPLEALGIPTRDGTAVEQDPRTVWQRFAERYVLFRATPTAAWLDYQLALVFGIDTRLDGESAQYVYDELMERLRSPEYRPRALFKRFGIEVLTTTNAATDSLDHHRALGMSQWYGVVLPCFRPDAMLRIASPVWREEVDTLARLDGAGIHDSRAFIGALERRRTFFKSMGATSSDHAVVEPYTALLSDDQVEAIFQRALRQEATAEDQRRFQAHMLIEMARMSIDDGLVMQLHPGSFRDHHTSLAMRFGPDVGADIPVATEYTRNLHALLNEHGSDRRLTLILFTLDESTYTRELAPLAGHYPSVRLGPPWWFHDSMDGMRRFRESVTETAGIYNTVGFNDDTRAFCSIPARHDLARRIDANWLASLVARHVIDLQDGREMARALAYDLPRRAYKLDTLPHAGARASSDIAPQRDDVAH